MKNEITNKKLEERFTYHPPKDSDVRENIEALRKTTISLAKKVNKLCPDSREKSLAITKLEEALMWSVKSVVLNGQNINKKA